MNVLPIDLTAIIAIVLGMMVVLIPIAGLTARFALKPTVEALSSFFESKGRDETVALLERRCALLEQQVEVMESQVHRLTETSAFDRALLGTSEGSSTTPQG